MIWLTSDEYLPPGFTGFGGGNPPDDALVLCLCQDFTWVVGRVWLDHEGEVEYIHKKITEDECDDDGGEIHDIIAWKEVKSIRAAKKLVNSLVDHPFFKAAGLIKTIELKLKGDTHPFDTLKLIDAMLTPNMPTELIKEV